MTLICNISSYSKTSTTVWTMRCVTQDPSGHEIVHIHKAVLCNHFGVLFGSRKAPVSALILTHLERIFVW